MAQSLPAAQARHSAPRRRTFTGLLRQFFCKDQEGSTAVEFAFLAIPFLATIIFVLQSGYIVVVGHSLEVGVRDASRLIKTGQVQLGGISRNDFRDLICDNVAISQADCKTSLVIDVRSFDAFEDITRSPNNLVATSFQPGDGEQIVLVSASLPTDAFTPIHRILGGAGDYTINLSAASAFRNEPF